MASKIVQTCQSEGCKDPGKYFCRCTDPFSVCCEFHMKEHRGNDLPHEIFQLWRNVGEETLRKVDSEIEKLEKEVKKDVLKVKVITKIIQQLKNIKALKKIPNHTSDPVLQNAIHRVNRPNNKKSFYLLPILAIFFLVFVSIYRQSPDVKDDQQQFQDLSDQNFSGFGKQVEEDGSFYVGEFLDGERNGFGKITYPNYTYYVGDFRFGMPHGSGELRNPDNKVLYKGNWKFGRFDKGLSYKMNEILENTKSFVQNSASSAIEFGKNYFKDFH